MQGGYSRSHKINKSILPMVHFWLTIFTIFLLSGYFANKPQWATLEIVFLLIVVLFGILYCICHAKRMLSYHMKKMHVIFTELGFCAFVICSICFNVYGVMGNGRVNFLAIVILTILILPAVISNTMIMRASR